MLSEVIYTTRDRFLKVSSSIKFWLVLQDLQKKDCKVDFKKHFKYLQAYKNRSIQLTHENNLK